MDLPLACVREKPSQKERWSGEQVRRAWRGAALQVGKLYQLAAGGSRELPSAIASPSASGLILFPQTYSNASNHGRSWVVRGSRLLPTYRAAILKSGSPPGL